LYKEFAACSLISGPLSDRDILKCIENEEIVIYPFEEKNLTPLGYNFTPSEFILSLNNKLLVKIYNNEEEKYCFIEPNDTVLILTREAITVSKRISGTFHSKVGVVSKGFGHIATTLDPLWQGPLLISLNNPTNKKIKLTIAKISKISNVEIQKKISYEPVSFVTLMLNKMVSSALTNHDNKSGRFDLLRNTIEVPKARFLDKLKFWKGNKNHFKNLQEMISEIGSIDFSEKDSSKSKKDFENHYQNLMKVIDFYTDQAHEASKQIINYKYIYKLIIRGIYVIVLILIMISAWKLGVQLSNPAMITFFTLVMTFALKPLFDFLNNKYKEGK